MEGLEVVPTAISILVVLAVLAGTLLVLRWVSSLRMGGSRRDRRNGNSVTVVERHSLGRTGSIVVMRYAGREHVLGVTEASITHLADGTIDLRDRNEAEQEVAQKRAGNPVARTLDSLREKTVRH